MNDEPVAWMCPTGLEYKQRAKDFMYNDALYDTKLNWIPLYTHPASKAKDRFPNYESICLQCGTTIYKPFKELTDEEILQVMINVYSDTVPPIRGVEFARAILRKASEK